MTASIARRLRRAQQALAAIKSPRRLFIHRGYLPETKPGTLVCIPGFDTDTDLPPGWEYCPGHSPAERDAWFKAGNKDLPPIVGKPNPDGTVYVLPPDQRQKPKR